MAAAKKKAPAASKAAKKAKAKKADRRTTPAPRTEPAGPKGVAEPKLSEEAQIFAVTELACFRTPSEVAEALKTEYGVEITRQSVQRYDPTTYAGRTLSEKLKTVFSDARRRWREETADIAISGKAARIRELESLAKKAAGMNNLALAKEIYKQIAEEMGDVFTNKRTLDGKLGVGGEVAFKPDLSGLTDEQLDVLDRISGALAGEPKRQGRH